MAVILNTCLNNGSLPGGIIDLMEKVSCLALEWAGIPANAEVGLVICDDDTVRSMNKEWRGVDGTTDVLSFPMLDDPSAWEAEGEEVLLGDIFISLPRAKEQSVLYGHSLQRELLYLFVHGLLHLLGQDHQDESGREEMRRQEEKLLAAVGEERK